MKQWSYKEVTDCTEREIKYLVSASRRRVGDDAEFLRQWAYGAYLMWEMLTMGHCDPLDDVRLQALANSMEKRGGAEGQGSGNDGDRAPGTFHEEEVTCGNEARVGLDGQLLFTM
jgi:hypothetical protein